MLTVRVFIFKGPAGGVGQSGPRGEGVNRHNFFFKKNA